MKEDRIMKKFRLSPLQGVALSFLAVILLGAFLLFLPISHQENAEPVRFMDALFTATSSTCVTGLVVVPTFTQWSLFGQIVIICLIQIGGLSFISMMMFVSIIAGKKLTLKNRLLVQATFNQNELRGMAQIVLRAIRVAFACEGVAALILFLHFLRLGIGFPKALWWGIFHAVSAFCNAGFDIIGPDSLVVYQTDIVINIVIMSLIVIGGLGVSVWGDLAYYFKKTSSKKIFQNVEFVCIQSWHLLQQVLYWFLVPSIFSFQNIIILKQ